MRQETNDEGVAARRGAVSVLRFALCDPEDAPASELLAEMTDELDDLYGTSGRLDQPKLLPSELRAPHGIYLVGWEGAVPLGGGGLRRLSEGVAEIKRMFVRPPARSRGIAGELLSALETTAWSSGYRRLRLDTGPKQVHALRLYARAGFAPVEPYNDNPFACFWGEKDLHRPTP